MRFTVSILIIAAVTLFGWQSAAVAQCCAAGNPVNSSCSDASYGAGVLNVTYSYLYSYSDTYYKGTRALDKTYAESYFNYSSLALSYGISDKLRLTADVGYYFDKSQRFLSSDYTRFATGISDATVGLNYTTYTSDDRLFEMQQTARITLPLGEFSQEYDGIILPIDFQPSSGNYRYNIGVNLFKQFEGSDFALMSFNSAEFSQAIETESIYHKYGNLYSASLVGAYRVSPLVQTLLQLRYEVRERALTGSLAPGAGAASNSTKLSYLNASGGVIAYLSPQVSLNLFDAWALSFQYNYPVYRNIYGEEQLSNTHSVSVNFSRIFDFSGGTEAPSLMELHSSNDMAPAPPAQTMNPEPVAVAEETSAVPEEVAAAPEQTAAVPEETETLPVSVEVTVGGSCSMCKTRIEKIALKTADVQSASWDSESQVLTVSYDKAKPEVAVLQKALAAAGHDAGDHTAPDNVYNKLPRCCHYR